MIQGFCLVLGLEAEFLSNSSWTSVHTSSGGPGSNQGKETTEHHHPLLKYTLPLESGVRSVCGSPAADTKQFIAGLIVADLEVLLFTLCSLPYIP